MFIESVNVTEIKIEIILRTETEFYCLTTE